MIVATAVFAILLALGVWWAARARAPRPAISHHDATKRFTTTASRVWVLIAVAAFLIVPLGTSWLGLGGRSLADDVVPGLPADEFTLTVLILAGIFAIGALSLNVLIGFTGQVSFGHSAFAGIGAYAAGYFAGRIAGGNDDLLGFSINGWQLPPIIWLPVVVAIGAVTAAAVGPFALRLRGNYLAIVSFAVLAVGQYLFVNLSDVTGGTGGRSPLPQPGVVIGDVHILDFDVPGASIVLGHEFTRNQGYFWAVWLLVALTALLIGNLVRTRQGRAMMAVRDRDLSAELIGIPLAATKIKSFAVSGAFVALSGALYGSYVQSIGPDTFGLDLAIQYLVMIIIGGIGTVGPTIAGAVVVTALPLLVSKYQDGLSWVPFLQTDNSQRGLTSGNLVEIIYGSIIILFLILQPKGLGGLWARLRSTVANWPLAER